MRMMRLSEVGWDFYKGIFPKPPIAPTSVTSFVLVAFSKDLSTFCIILCVGSIWVFFYIGGASLFIYIFFSSPLSNCYLLNWKHPKEYFYTFNLWSLNHDLHLLPNWSMEEAYHLYHVSHMLDSKCSHQLRVQLGFPCWSLYLSSTSMLIYKIYFL